MSSATATGPLPTTGRGRRNVEAVMMVFALLVVLVAYSIVGLAVQGTVEASIIPYAVGFTVLFGAAHVVVRKVAPYADPLLLPAVVLLNGLGLVLIHRLDLAEGVRAAQRGVAAPRVDAPVQMVWTLLGLLLFTAVLLVVRDHRNLARYAYTLGAIGLVLLALPALLPAQYSQVNGAKIWIRVAGFSIQPGEFAKIALLVFYAAYLVRKRDVLALASRRFAGIDLPRGRDLGPVLVAWVASLMVLVAERDLGSSLLNFALFLVVLYVATERTSWLVIGFGLFLGGAFSAYHYFGHVRDRVDIWLHPFADPQNASYQLVQSLFGLAQGGLTGTGLGQGRPDQVPFAKTDFIVATVGEELGLVGLMAMLLLYGLIVERGLRTALSVRDGFGKLLAAGLAFSLAVQVFVVVGGVTRLIPLTGLTTPFLSYGGSSLVANYALVALLLRISDAARRPSPVVTTPSTDTSPPPEDQAMTQVVRR